LDNERLSERREEQQRVEGQRENERKESLR
jgi:hypothetical protein